uniref:Uncharacterized protein n=1 Tax=Avena sativa TaxID=4498 RepID=A0ACD5XDI6_AVESA
MARHGKVARKKRIVFAGERNMASPAPILKLYKSLTDDQRNAIVSMGHGSFIDIKCEQLHNPVIYWFAQCYDPARRSFVISRRGVIPLTEESIHDMIGLPCGQLAVKYFVDYDLEAEIAAKLFPGESSRPKVSEIGKKIAEYKEADETFRELWMLFITSIVVAPTTDTRMSNKCYPMLEDVGQAQEMNMCKFIADELHKHLSNKKYTKGCLLYCMFRYFSALDTDDMDLGFEHSQFAINCWTKDAIDVLGEMDAQEFDSTVFECMKGNGSFWGARWF